MRKEDQLQGEKTKISIGIMALKVKRVGWILRKESRTGGDWGLPRNVGVGGRNSQRHFPSFQLYRPGQSLLHIIFCILEKEIGHFDQADKVHQQPAYA